MSNYKLNKQMHWKYSLAFFGVPLAGSILRRHFLQLYVFTYNKIPLTWLHLVSVSPLPIQGEFACSNNFMKNTNCPCMSLCKIMKFLRVPLTKNIFPILFDVVKGIIFPNNYYHALKNHGHVADSNPVGFPLFAINIPHL